MPTSGPQPNRQERRWLQPEAFSLTLSVDGKWAGEQHWQTELEKLPGGERGYLTRVQTDYGGVLPALRRVQLSHMRPDLSSLHYSEGDGRGKPSFETLFDPGQALLTLRQGRDSASIPLLTPHHDPVSLLMRLRSPQAPQSPWRAALAGGNVQVQPLEVAEGRAYLLRPGGAYVLVEAQPPYRPLRLVQPTDFGAVEATLQLPPPTPPSKARRRAK